MIVAFIGCRIEVRRSAALLEPSFQVSLNNQLDGKLLRGAAIFGVGWDIAGFCLTGALPALGALNTDLILFVAALVEGMFIARQLSGFMAARSTD